MTALKQTKSSTALVRILALPIMVGALAGCDFASKLPDAPSNLGGYSLSEKPPSVTGPQQVDRLPPPPEDAFAKLKAPVEDRTQIPSRPKVAMADKPALKAPTAQATRLPVPSAPSADTPLDQIAFNPLDFEAPGNDSAGASLDVAAQNYAPQQYEVNEAPEYQAYDSASLDTYAVAGQTGQPELTAYDSAPIQTQTYSNDTYAQVPVEGYAIAAPPSMPVESYSAPAASNPSAIAVLRSRLPNGAVVNVHPVIGAPGVASATLARTVVTSIGSPINEAAAASASVAFDLRGRAERNTNGFVSVEWTLLDANRNVVGIFPERQDGGNWSEMSEAALRSMGQRVADRIARNGEMRKATLYAAANPVNDIYQAAPAARSTFILQNGATLANAPVPRTSPRAATTYSAPVQVAAPRAPVTMQPIVSSPAPVVAQAASPVIRAAAPTPLVAPAPVRAAPTPPQVVTQAPRPVAPPPTFDTLRPTNNTQPVAAPTVVASGPRPLVFRGVQGAPGDGDQALGREVGKLLAQSGARMSTTAQPGALFLTAQVSKTPRADSDRIEIIWRVQDSSGENIGQVTQANDVPRGMLDNAWGEDAFYAAEGARDGIMELLQGVGALDS